MKQSVAIAAIVFASTVASASASNPTVWQGDTFITSTTSACGPLGISVGDVRQTIFAPKNLPGNGTVDRLAIFRQGSSSLLVPLSGTLNGATAFQNYTIGHAATFGDETVQNQGPFTVTPSNISATTPSITVKYLWKNNFGSGCNIGVEGVLMLRPGTLPQ